MDAVASHGFVEVVTVTGQPVGQPVQVPRRVVVLRLGQPGPTQGSTTVLVSRRMHMGLTHAILGQNLGCVVVVATKHDEEPEQVVGVMVLVMVRQPCGHWVVHVAVSVTLGALLQEAVGQGKVVDFKRMQSGVMHNSLKGLQVVLGTSVVTVLHGVG
ncbi:MAG: hypothetical protein M1829_004907 [Trizodia sp. TS-e1964]|nr:MAG: hypothetical protein M1829_004907 [Trizodia sp. TS-e1964]